MLSPPAIQATVTRLEGEAKVTKRQLEVSEEAFQGEKAEVLRLFESLQAQESQARC